MYSDDLSDLCKRDELLARATWNQQELDMMEQNFKKGKEPSIIYQELISSIEEELEKVIRKMQQLKQIIRHEKEFHY